MLEGVDDRIGEVFLSTREVNVFREWGEVSMTHAHMHHMVWLKGWVEGAVVARQIGRAHV